MRFLRMVGQDEWWTFHGWNQPVPTSALNLMIRSPARRHNIEDQLNTGILSVTLPTNPMMWWNPIHTRSTLFATPCLVSFLATSLRFSNLDHFIIWFQQFKTSINMFSNILTQYIIAMMVLRIFSRRFRHIKSCTFSLFNAPDWLVLSPHHLQMLLSFDNTLRPVP